MEIIKSYKVQLYPTKEQEQKMLQIFGACRWVWNHYLEKRSNYYRENKKNLSYPELARDLTKLRYEIDWLKDIQAEPLHQMLRRLERTYRNFFRKVSKFPKFKSKKDENQSFQKHSDWKIQGNKIRVKADLCIRYRGTINQSAKLGTITIKHTNTNKWFATITAVEQIELPKKYSKSVGIDVGIKTLATLSDGKKFANIQPQKTLQSKLKKAQRNLARKQKGSNRRKKAKVEVAKLYEKIKNIRSNYLHKVSHEITSKNHAMIAVEDLNVEGMVKNHSLSRALVDASFGEFFRQVEYKQRWKNGLFVKIGRFVPSSKKCNS
jgi:putative transposase